MTKEEIVKLVETSLNYVVESFKTIDKSFLEKTFKHWSGKVVPTYTIFPVVLDHVTNHRAKANLYIRLAGYEPPAYKYF